MSEIENEPTEMELLKQRADLMGVTYSNNIGLETLRKRVQDAMDGVPPEPEALPTVDQLQASLHELSQTAEPEAKAEANPLIDQAVPPTKTPSLREHMLMTQMKLVRIRVQNLDPKKSNLHGEFFTVANEYLGNITKFVPFGEVTDNGYHVPYCIYKLLKSRKFLNVRERKLPGGKVHIETGWVKEFALEVLPDLTPYELQQLAQAQIAAGSVS